MLVHRKFSMRALFALVPFLASVLLYAVPAGSAVLSTGVIGGFEQDGNQTREGTLDSSARAATLDWLTADSLGTVRVVGDDSADSGFTQGSKELQPGGWDCSTGGATPAKGNIVAAFVNPRVSATDLFLDLAFIRELGDEAGGKGDVHVNFEFNQADAPETPPPFVAGPCGITRAAGDMLVTYDFPGGSDAPSIEVYRWTTDGGGDWVNSVITANKVAGAVNDVAIHDLVGGNGILNRQRFGEATLDLAGILDTDPGQCVSFGSVNVRSRASGESWTSMLQDKLPGTGIDFSTCGRIDLIKTGDHGELLAGADFQLYLDDGDRTFDAGDTPQGDVCTTDAAGACSWDELNPGVYFVRETAPPAGYSPHQPASGLSGPIDLGFRRTVTLSAVNFKWVYRLNLTADATNLVGHDHVFTATLEVKKTATGTYAAAAGETLDIALLGAVGSIVSPGAACATNAAGQCAITIRSADPGDSTLEVSFDDTVTTAPVDASDEAVKHWVDYGIDIAPDATNRVGSAHTFTVTLERDSGSGPEPVAGAHPLVSKVSGPGVLSADTCATSGTDAAGQCTVVLTSDVVGVTVVQAVYTAAEEEVDNTFTDRATKTWVDFDLIVEFDGVNHAGDDHTFTVRLVERVRGTWVGLEGQTVALDWDGTGSIAPAASCVTDENGECAVVASSNVTGQGTLTATWDRRVDSGLIELEDSAEKTWIDWDISIAPDGRTNLVGSDHTFTVTVRFDAGDGAGLQPLAGATPDIDLDGAGSIKADDCDEGTAADGTCTVVITSAAPGDSQVTATWEAVDAGSGVSEHLEGGAVKHWVDYRILVEKDAVNVVGDDHVFTVTLTRDGGDGFAPLPDAGVRLAWSGGTGSSVTAASPAGATPLDSCRTDAAGQCRVTVSSGTTLTGTLTATYGTTLDSGTYTFSSDATKRWVNWGLSVTPPAAENLVNSSHTFSVKVVHDAGRGGGPLPLAGARPVVTLAGPGSISANTCPAGTDAAGTCTVTITSSTTGTSTVTAAFSAEEGEASATLSAQATKLWVDYRITVAPKTAVNPVNTTHTFTVTLEKDTGSGFRPAPAEKINLDLTGPGSIASVDSGSAGSDVAGTCTTDSAGTCRVTITSPLAGEATITGTYHAVVGPTTGDYTDWGLKIWEIVPVVLGAIEERPELPPLVLGAIEERPELPRTGAAPVGLIRFALQLTGLGIVIRHAGRRRGASTNR